jgi:lipopolysaccharide export system protein LptA
MDISSLLASTDDTQKPITIEADQAELDEKNQIGKYLGNVVLQQGDIKIRADKLTVFSNEGQLLRLTAEGNPIEFFQHRDNKEDIRGTSLKMEYDAEAKHFILMNNAELWQGKNRFSGEHIQFDPEKETVIATGSKDKGGNNGQRVQITIQPKSQDKNQ